MVTRATLVVEFEADRDSPLYKTCQSENIDYVGLCTAPSYDHQAFGEKHLFES